MPGQLPNSATTARNSRVANRNQRTPNTRAANSNQRTPNTGRNSTSVSAWGAAASAPSSAHSSPYVNDSQKKKQKKKKKKKAGHCACTTGCKHGRCACAKNKTSCTADCKCTGCKNGHPGPAPIACKCSGTQKCNQVTCKCLKDNLVCSDACGCSAATCLRRPEEVDTISIHSFTQDDQDAKLETQRRYNDNRDARLAAQQHQLDLLSAKLNSVLLTTQSQPPASAQHRFRTAHGGRQTNQVRLVTPIHATPGPVQDLNTHFNERESGSFSSQAWQNQRRGHHGTLPITPPVTQPSVPPPAHRHVPAFLSNIQGTAYLGANGDRNSRLSADLPPFLQEAAMLDATPSPHTDSYIEHADLDEWMSPKGLQMLHRQGYTSITQFIVDGSWKNALLKEQCRFVGSIMDLMARDQPALAFEALWRRHLSLVQQSEHGVSAEDAAEVLELRSTGAARHFTPAQRRRASKAFHHHRRWSARQ